MTTAAATWTGFPCLLRSHLNSTFYPFANFSANFVKFITNCQVSHQAVVVFLSAQMKNVNLTVWWKPIKKETLNNVRGVPPPRKLTPFAAASQLSGQRNQLPSQTVTLTTGGDSKSPASRTESWFFLFSLALRRASSAVSQSGTYTRHPRKGLRQHPYCFMIQS